MIGQDDINLPAAIQLRHAELYSFRDEPSFLDGEWAGWWSLIPGHGIDVGWVALIGAAVFDIF